MTTLREAAQQALEALETAVATAPARDLAEEVRMLQEQNTALDKKLSELSERRLTDEVIADLWHKNGTYHHHFARAIERWLKGQE